MLSQISWADFASTIAAITVFYYIATVIHYYRYEIAYYFSAKEKQQPVSFTTSYTESKVEES